MAIFCFCLVEVLGSFGVSFKETSLFFKLNSVLKIYNMRPAPVYECEISLFLLLQENKQWDDLLLN